VADRDAAFRAFAQENRVSAEISPHFEIDDHNTIQTAFDLTLFAARPTACRGDPACELCLRVREELAALARRVIPPGAHYSLHPFSASFHLRREADWAPEIELIVEILPRDRGPGLEQVDDSARRVVAAVREHLARLGVASDAWRPTGGGR
jgi:hypothetical protein